MRFGVIDEIIREPKGGAHRDPALAIKAVGEAVAAALMSLAEMDRAAITAQRRDKFLAIGRIAA
jgi:acetyl-CoA carboxylase carboxyl transferase subunit alpha